MTITKHEIHKVAPDVTHSAQGHSSAVINPFITLQSLESLCQGNETLDYCLHEMVIDCLRYAQTICRYKQVVLRGQVSNEDDARKDIEILRTAIHDATMDSINLLVRNLKKAGKETPWISMMMGNRAAYGKFALLIAFEIVQKEWIQ